MCIGALFVFFATAACSGDSNGDSVVVPDVIGMSLDDATSEITGAGLVVGEVSHEYSETTPAGRVISQEPVGGEKVSAGTEVDLAVSLGSETVTVPDVTGMSLDDAKDEITDAGLMVGEVTYDYSETVPEGHVISQEPAGGETVSPGSAVDLVVSLGEPWLLDSPYDFGPYQHKVQLHSHTTQSDGDHAPSWVMQAYEDLGYAAVAITDHDYTRHSASLTDPGGHNIIHIPGVEYSGDNSEQSWNHMLGIGIATIHHLDGTGARQAQIDQAAAEGGITFLCHPYDDTIHRRGWNDDELLEVMDYTGIEIHNGGSYHNPGGRDYAYKVDLALSAGRKIFLISVDDFHRNPESTMDRGHVVVNSYSNSDDIELEDIMLALEMGNFFAAGRVNTGHPYPPRFLDISVSGLTVTVETDKVTDIEFITDRHNYYKEGDNYSHKVYETTLAEYKASPDDVFVRIKAVYTEDGNESYAWSNPLYVLPAW